MIWPVLGLGALLAAPMAPGQEYEYEPGEGLHREEWYDPSDWFDTSPGTDYEADWWDYSSTYDDYWNDDLIDNNFWNSATIDRGNQNYGWHYDWDPITGRWQSDYGYHTSQYDFDASGDYGWHYDWNPQQNEWVSDYGYHSSNWDFDYNRFNYDQQNQQQRQQAQSTAQRQKQQDQQKARQQAAQTGNRHTVRGEIEAIRRVGTGGQQGQGSLKTLADVRLQSGQRVVVDLGRQQNSNLQEGDRVVLRGRTIQMNGRQVLLADQIRSGGEVIGGQQAIGTGMGQQRGSGRSEQMQRSDASGSVQITGQVQEIRRANLGGTRENHTIVRVKLQNGRTEIVDLGPNFAEEQGGERVQQLLDRADEGKRITVRGERQQVDGRSVIRARQFRLDGERVLQQKQQQQSGDE